MWSPPLTLLDCLFSNYSFYIRRRTTSLLSIDIAIGSDHHPVSSLSQQWHPLQRCPRLFRLLKRMDTSRIPLTTTQTGIYLMMSSGYELPILSRNQFWPSLKHLEVLPILSSTQGRTWIGLRTKLLGFTTRQS